MSQFRWQSGVRSIAKINGYSIEFQCFGPSPYEAPTWILLHEGLGCIDLWRDLPQRISQLTGAGVVVFSRAGYGRSDPVLLPRSLSYMTEEAMTFLPAFIKHLQVREFILLGHSDGASIAAIYAGVSENPGLRGLVMLAPHFFAESICLEAIKELKNSYENSTALKEKLSKYHTDPDNAFYGWCNTWLDKRFSDWNISNYIAQWRIPAIAIQGMDDQYGSLKQLNEITVQARVPISTIAISHCGHSPQFENTSVTLAAINTYYQCLQSSVSSASDANQLRKLRRAQSLCLPDYKHQPGNNPRPNTEYLQDIAQAASMITTASDVRDNIAWQYGLRLINNGYYWEAHEVLEAVWNHCAQNSPEKHLVQAIIQLTNAALKQDMQLTKAAARLCTIANEYVDRAASTNAQALMGLSLAHVRDQIARVNKATDSFAITLNI